MSRAAPQVGWARPAAVTACRSPIRLLALLALTTAVFVQAQLTASTMWTWLTGEGVYRHAGHACYGLATYLIGSLLAAMAPQATIRALDGFRPIRYLRIAAVALGLTILYPAAFHYFYDIPPLILAVGILASLLLGLASLRSSRWLPSFTCCVVLALGSFLNVPHYSWDITDLRHTLNVLAILNAIVVLAGLAALLRRLGWRPLDDELLDAERREPSAALRVAVFVLFTACFMICYLYAGVGKVALSSRTPWLLDGLRWIWQERLDNLLQIFWHMGATWLAPPVSADQVFALFSNVWVRSVANFVVLFGEFAVLAAFFSRRAFIWGILACQALHIGFTFVAGTYFIHWFVLNFVFLALYSRPAFSEMQQLLSYRQRVVLTCVAVLVAPLILNTVVLSWCTSNENVRIFTWHLDSVPPGAEGGPPTTAASYLASHPQVNPNRFFPYEKSFQMSWRFSRLVKPPLEAEPPHRPSFSGRFLNWYKLRLTGEWHEHLPRSTDVQQLEQDLQKLLARFHWQQLYGQPSLWPPYYTHMAYNPTFFPKVSPEELRETTAYVLVEQALTDRGVLEMERQITPLWRVDVSPLARQDHAPILRR